MTNGVKPVAFVLANLLASLQFYDVAGLLAYIAADIFIVVDVAEETDALRVFALGIDEVFALSYFPHLVFHVVANWEYGFLQLPLEYLREKIGLVFHRVGTCSQPFLAVNTFCLRVVPCGDQVVVVPHLLVERAKLYQPVAHHVGIGREAGLTLSMV